MRKNIISLITLIIIARVAYSQTAVSNNGEFVSVKLVRELQPNELILQSTKNSWKKVFYGVEQGMFNKSSQKYLFRKSDTLCIQTLNSDTLDLVVNVSSFKQPDRGAGDWLAYLVNKPEVELVVMNLFNGKSIRVKNVINYLFDYSGKTIVVESKSSENRSETKICWITLDTLEIEEVLLEEGDFKFDYKFDNAGTSLAIFGTHQRNTNENAIWISHLDMKKAYRCPVDFNLGDSLSIDSKPVAFTKSGGYLLFYLKPKHFPKKRGDFTSVDIWSFLDPKLQSIQAKDAEVTQSYAAVINLMNYRITRLEYEDDKLMGRNQAELQINDHYALVCHFENEIFTYDNGNLVQDYSMLEYNWNRSTISSVVLVSLKDGTRTVIKNKLKATAGTFPLFEFSPGENYVVFFDGSKRSYFVYQIGTGSTMVLASNTGINWIRSNPEDPVTYFYRPVGIFGWERNDSSILLYDHWSDIWKISAVDHKQPTCITKGLGRKFNGRIFLTTVNAKKVFDPDEKIILRANARDYLNDGYYCVSFGGKSNLQTLIAVGEQHSCQLEKALDAELYLLALESNEEPIKYYYTRDFKSRTLVNNGSSDNRVTGIKREVITWKTFDGKISKGILFKPRNFDLQKRYPLIFIYYEKEFVRNNIYMPYGNGNFVDSGYLVFCPDIHYTLGETGASAYNSILSAAMYLSKFPFVDSKKMGVMGASFSGFETNYLITHSNIFAAAWSSCGISDLISHYGTEEEDLEGYNNSAGSEIGQNRIGVTMWQRPDIYIKNSPIFYADRVTTPLVILHNKDDYRVPFSQGVEFFKALRRLGKRVWLLQYDGQAHEGLQLYFGNDGDKEIRKVQFFDHYLKGKPAPVWMTRGIPTRLKGTTLNYEYDTIIKTPGEGLLMDNEAALTPQQKELLRHKTTVTDDGRIIDVIGEKRRLKTKDD